jgi:hypothetical protein
VQWLGICSGAQARISELGAVGGKDKERLAFKKG